MSMIIDGTNGLTFNNATTQASAGVVLQVVQGTYATQVEIANTTYADSGLTATITPKFATSKILVLISQEIGLYSNTNGQINANYKLLRGSTAIVTNTQAFELQSAQGGSGYQGGNWLNALNYLDSPATTSATTYKTQGCLTGSYSNTAIRFQVNATTSTITLMEIAQ